MSHKQTMEIYSQYGPASDVWCERDNRYDRPYQVVVRDSTGVEQVRGRHDAYGAYMEVMRLRLLGHAVPDGLLDRLKRECHHD